MRALLVVALFTLGSLAGCLSDDDVAVDPDSLLPPLDPSGIVVPEGATLVETATGAALEWAGAAFPFRTTVTVPSGATLVRIEALVAADQAVSTYLFHEETGRRRCNPDIVDSAWNVPYRGGHACSGIALIDPPGTNWTVTASSPSLPAAVPGGAPVPPTPAEVVRVVFDRVPLDGIVSLLDLAQLSMPTHALLPTTGGYVASFDGTELWVEVTLPEGEGPWPTIIGASPYNGQVDRLSAGGQPAMWGYFTHDWAKRGYAIVNVDVRGFGLSGGCVEVWSENEQRDQAFIVDWVADQAWSDGTVGFYGQSYVATTPVAAAVYAPEALKAIVAVAPVISAYDDWHYGGVPNGENTGSPVAYQALTDLPPTPGGPGTASFEYYTDPPTAATNKAKGLCHPQLVAEANDPRAIYDAFYEERDFKKRAGNVRAATLFTQGFEDSNVKSAMIPGWFNDLEAPKLGVFGHWVHQHPTRADEEILFLGWMDQYVKGRPLGFEALPQVVVATNNGLERTGPEWPPTDATEWRLWPDYAGGAFSADAEDAAGADLVVASGAAPVPGSSRTVSYTLTEDVAVSGIVGLELRGTLKPGGNAFIGARLYDVSDGRRDLVTYGAFNLAHDPMHTTWMPVTGESDVLLPFLPTEYVFQAGHELQLEVYAIGPDALAVPGLGAGGVFAIGEHTGGVGALVLPTLPLDGYRPLPQTARP